MSLTLLSPAAANAAISAILPTGTTFKLSAHDGTPGTTGATHEVVGGSYARKTITLGTPTNGVKTSSVSVSYPTMPSTTVDHLYFWKTTTPKAGLPTTASVTVPLGSTLAIASSAINAQVQG